jgi:hypothetical protein
LGVSQLVERDAHEIKKTERAARCTFIEGVRATYLKTLHVRSVPRESQADQSMRTVTGSASGLGEPVVPQTS